MTGLKKRLARSLLKLARRLDPPTGSVTYNINAIDTHAAIQAIERRRGMGGLSL